MISDDLEAVIADFGLAVIVEDLDKLPLSSAVKYKGNPHWTAPELQLLDIPTNKEADVWSFGMVCLEVLSSCSGNYPQVYM